MGEALTSQRKKIGWPVRLGNVGSEWRLGKNEMDEVLMIISNSNFSVHLFDKEGASGTCYFKFRQITVEIDVKHSTYDWYGVKPYFSMFKHQTVTRFAIWLPHGFKCIGWRINIFLWK